MIGREAAASAQSVAGRTSRFWTELFDERPNFPDINSFLGFRRDNFGYGMADERQGGLDRERDYFNRAHEIFRWSVSKEAVSQVPEPSLGAPYAFEADGLYRSSAFWVNATTAHRVKDFIDRFGPQGRPLNILEIGAGWGAAAYQLHHLIEVGSYTIVDLPQNLLLSTTYLASTLDRKLTLVGCEGAPIIAPPDKGLVGLLPGAIPRLAYGFDLVLNSFSFQEMDAETVETYLAWCQSALTDDGLLISINSHGKSGIKRPSEYRYSRFKLHHMGMFRRFPSGFLNTIPYEVVMSRRSSTIGPESEQVIDAFGFLIQLGMDEELKVPIAEFIGGQFSAQEIARWGELSGFFSSDTSRRASVLSGNALLHMPEIREYLMAQHLLDIGNSAAAVIALRSALATGLSGFAAVRAEVLLACLEGRRELRRDEGLIDATTAYPDVMGMLEAGDFTPMLHQFRRIVNA